MTLGSVENRLFIVGTRYRISIAGKLVVTVKKEAFTIDCEKNFKNWDSSEEG
jgi:uncharacterized protein YxjI